MRNPAVLVGVAAVLLAAGFAAGYKVGERRAVEEGSPRSPSNSAPSTSRTPTDARSGGSTSTDTPTSDSTRDKLRERVVELEAEVRLLREETGKPSTAGGGPGGEVAKQAYDDMLALASGELSDPERLRSLIIRLSQLDPKLARFFIDKYRAAAGAGGSENERFVAMQLAAMSGGPEAADFVQQLLNDPSLSANLRTRLLTELSPPGTGFFSIKRLPVGESLRATAMTLVRSEKPDERRGGAGLLGGTPTPAARVELARLLAADTDSTVRQVAARSLGLIGDASSRKLLETYAAQTTDVWLQKAAAAAIKDYDATPR